VYLTDTDGTTHVIEAATKYKLFVRSKLGEKTETTPALVDGHIFMRTEKRLFCIGKSQKQ
jgi:hypothetical protein